MWCVLLKATTITIDTCRRDERVVGHLSSHACNVLRTMLRAKTKEQKQRVLEIFGIQETCCHFPMNWGDEESDDQVYIDDNISFDTMAKVVDYLRSIQPKKKTLDMSIVAPEMQEVVETWLAYKKEKAQTYKPTGFKTFYKKLCELSSNNPQVAMAIIEQSMQNNYAGIFPLRNNNNQLYGTRTQSEKLRDTVIHANEFSQMLHNRVEQQATMGNGDSEEIRRLQDIF